MSDKFNPNGLEAQGQHLVQKLLGATHRETSRFSFTPSSLPYCAIRHTLHQIAKDAKEPHHFFRESSYLQDAGAAAGTAIHANAQKWFARLGWLYGRWRCSRALFHILKADDDKPMCDRLQAVGPSFYPGPCECGSEREYVELKLQFGEWIIRRSYLDGLLSAEAIGLPSTEPMGILEIKGIGEKDIGDVSKPGGLPIKYAQQGSAYVHLVKENFGIDVGFVLFLFFAREKPRKIVPVFMNTAIKHAERMFTSLVDEYMATRNALETGDFSGVSGICCQEGDEPYCPCGTFCFTEEGNKMFDVLHYAARGTAPSNKPTFPFQIINGK